MPRCFSTRSANEGVRWGFLSATKPTRGHALSSSVRRRAGRYDRPQRPCAEWRARPRLTFSCSKCCKLCSSAQMALCRPSHSATSRFRRQFTSANTKSRQTLDENQVARPKMNSNRDFTRPNKHVSAKRHFARAKLNLARPKGTALGLDPTGTSPVQTRTAQWVPRSV